jgi:hypothetical protein
MAKCLARITRTFKKAKAEAIWPIVNGETNTHADKYPEECSGEVRALVRVEQEPYFGGTDYRLVAEIECSRCRFPWIPGWPEFRHRVAMEQKLDVSELVK